MAKLPINISLIAPSNAGGASSAFGINSTGASSEGSYFNLMDSTVRGSKSHSNEDWSKAWKQQQVYNESQNSQKQDSTDPSPLLIDAMSSLPPNSSRRRNLENIKLTLDGSSSNVGFGLDTMTRESYKDLKRLSKQSEMIQDGMNQPLPEQGQILGSEEGQHVSNLQDWKPAIGNAGKPVSDALGSHADIDFSVAKDAAGPSSFLPSSGATQLDGITPHLTNEIEGSFKHNQLELLQHLPTKLAGNLRQLSTAQDSILSVPFEIASDVYNGLRKLVSQVSDLLDAIKAKIMKWFIGPISGLIDGLFPEGMLSGIISAVSSIAEEFGGLFDMLGGFSIVNNIRNIMSNIISGNFMAALGNIAKLASLLGSGLGSGNILGGFAGSSVNCLERQVGLSRASNSFKGLNKNVVAGVAIVGILGALPSIGRGLGNLGSIIGKGISALTKGVSISNIRNLGGIIAGLLPMGIGFVLGKLFGKLCSVGVTGNNGYSVGSTFDKHRDNTFDRYIAHYAAHASIIGPLFNKKTTPTGAYAGESDISAYDNSSFVVGAQSTKGVTMVGPGASTFYKPFGVFQVAARRSNPQSSASANSINNASGFLPTVAL